MTPAEVIARKRDGQALSGEQIHAFIEGFTAGLVADYQMSALAMAIFIRGLEEEETAALTAAMLASGTQLRWPDGPPVVDKHSTGGIGDKVSLVLAPLLACCGLRVPMISGRGLGPTGGTLDKLESIPGFRTELSLAEIQAITNNVGCVIAGASEDIAPADRKLYGLRDVTATVASIPLITSSIMSKKLAEGLDCLVLDVKCGSGAFMKTPEAARQLARSLVDIGQKMNVATSAFLTEMDQPLGHMIGNAVEVNEAIETLEGGGPSDLVKLTLELAAELCVAAGVEQDSATAKQSLATHLRSGRARERFAKMVAAQGGDLDAPRPIAPASVFKADRAGYVHIKDAEQFGWAIIELGGGRRLKTDSIDPSVGLEMLVRNGDTVESGEPLVRIFPRGDSAETVRSHLRAAIQIQDERPTERPLILEPITAAQTGSEDSA